MKKFIIPAFLFCMLFVNSGDVFAQTQAQAQISKIEESLYGFSYGEESDSARLARLEQTVYGKTSAKSDAEKLKKLVKDVAADSIGKEITPVEDTFADNEPEYIYEEEPVATSDVSYPMVDEMERFVFKQSYPKQDIKTRISNLEKKSFNKTYPSDDLNTRVERLKAELNPQSSIASSSPQQENVFYDDDTPPLTDYMLGKYVPPGNFDYEAYNDMMNRRSAGYGTAYGNGYNSSYGNSFDSGFGNSFGSNSAPTPKKASLTTVEKKMLRQTFPNDTTENRLSRLETYMFGTQFSSDDVQTRLDRVSSAYQAQKSAGKYDSNKFTQNMATAMQIGTLILMVLACIL